MRPSVPAALSEQVYDIRYWGEHSHIAPSVPQLGCRWGFRGAVSNVLFCVVRDKRREGQLVGGTNKKHMVTYQVDVSELTQVSSKTWCPYAALTTGNFCSSCHVVHSGACFKISLHECDYRIFCLCI